MENGSSQPANFILKNGNSDYIEGTLLTVGTGSFVKLNAQCVQSSLTGSCNVIVSFDVKCYLSLDNAQQDVDAVNCKAYGIDYTLSSVTPESTTRRLEDSTNNKLTFTGAYTTPNSMRANVYVKISSVVDENQQDFVPQSKIIKLAIEPSINPTNNYFYGPQNKNICIVGEESLVATCNLKSLELPQGAFTISTNDECAGVAMNFAIGNVIPFNCTFDNGHQYNIYVKPTNESHLHPHMSISETETTYEESCTGSNAEEMYLAYDAFTMNIEQVKHVTACHQNIFNSIMNRPPRGHSYISVIFEVVSNSTEDSNAAPSTTWFKQEFEYALSEVSHVPIRDVYILSIVYNSATMSNTVTVIFDTTSSSGRDFMLQFTEQSDLVFDFISEINSKLDIIYPMYWNAHDLEVDSYDIEVYDNYCTSHIDSSIEFSYLTESGETDTQTMNDVTFESTIIWYYSYVPADESENYQQQQSGHNCSTR